MMVHNLRKSERYSIYGKVDLLGRDSRYSGEIVDISTGGLAVALDPRAIQRMNGRKAWVCRISSDDLPAPILCLVKVLRNQAKGYQTQLACEISAISKESFRFLQAYRALAKARARRLVRSLAKG